MLTQGRRTSLYTRRHWFCGGCGSRGMVLIHQEDTPEKQVWRREVSHKAQHRKGQCSGSRLRWYRVIEELDIDPEWSGTRQANTKTEYDRGYQKGYDAGRRTHLVSQEDQ